MNTYALNLDKAFSTVKHPEIEYVLKPFSGGERHIQLSPFCSYLEIDKVVITHRIRNTDNLMDILIAKEALEAEGVRKFELIIPYVPYARQDRRCEHREAFTLKVFTNILNSAKFDRVYCLDCHSDVAPALIENSYNLSNKPFVAKTLEHLNSDIILISPDAGSNKKANVLARILAFKKLVKCDKVRDTKTGDLSGFEVFADDLKGDPCLIVDDICDGGGTFIGLAEELKKKGAGDLYLFVTHGIFSKGVDPLLEHFTTIYTTNSFRDIKHPQVIQFNA